MQSQSQQRLIEHGYDPNADYEDAAQIPLVRLPDEPGTEARICENERRIK
jgi:hypothetical protein